MPLGECRGAVCNGWKRPADLSRIPKFRRKNTRKSFVQLAEIARDWRLARRCFAMAPDIHVDLYRHGSGLSRLPNLQRQLQAGSLRTARHFGSLADGLPLFFLRI